MTKHEKQIVVSVWKTSGSRVLAKLGNQNGKNGHLQQQTTANDGYFPF